MKKIAFILITTASFACNKEKKADDATCDNIQKITLFSNSPVTAGEPLNFGTQEVGGYRVYSWTGPANFTSQDVTNSISAVHLQSEGWYYLNLSHVGSYGDCQKIDSIYIDVTLPQGNPSCSVGGNTAQYSNLSDDTIHPLPKKLTRLYP